MRWEVQYPEPKGPKPFDLNDGIVCIGFAYGYWIAVLSLNIILFFIHFLFSFLQTIPTIIPLQQTVLH